MTEQAQEDTSLWTRGGLADYLRESCNTLAGAEDMCAGPCAEEYGMLVDVDRMMSDALGAVVPHGNGAGMLLGVSGYTLFLGGIRNALSGHAWTVYPVLRAALESICYWVKIEQDPNLAAVFSQRHVDEAARRRARSAFTSAVKDVVSVLGSEPDGVGTLTLQIYDTLIDFGAHPNPYALADAVSVTEEGNAWTASFRAIESLESIAVRRSMLLAVQTGAVMVAAMKSPPIAKGDPASCDLSDVATIFGRVQAYAEKHGEGK
jgi:hypothetical protein